MRGKASEGVFGFTSNGITPAYAGKRLYPALLHGFSQDHPRLCGEKSLSDCELKAVKGSPPPMRGKVYVNGLKLIPNRITPAYAGKSFLCHADFTTQLDHPRLCGEKPHPKQRGAEHRGSPPPMRGKASTLKTSRRFPGITPAYAGKRITCTLTLSLPQDHPRLCGEKCKPILNIVRCMGSPPPMRGKVQCNTGETLCNGITPAYAGKRLVFRRLIQRRRDHPRLCGEK